MLYLLGVSTGARIQTRPQWVGGLLKFRGSSGKRGMLTGCDVCMSICWKTFWRWFASWIAEAVGVVVNVGNLFSRNGRMQLCGGQHVIGYSSDLQNQRWRETELPAGRGARNYLQSRRRLPNHPSSTGHFWRLRWHRIASHHHNVVHTSPTSTWLELVSSTLSTFRSATWGFSASWLSAYSGPSCCKVRAKEERMVTIATKSIWREAKGRLC